MSDSVILFTVGDYEENGDLTDGGIYLHFGTTRIRIADTTDQFRKVIDSLEDIFEEIRENYRGL